MNSILHASFRTGKESVVYTKKVNQYDRGVILRVSGIALPEIYQAHFSNDPEGGVGIAKSVSGSDISIPDEYLETGKYIYVWLYFAETADAAGSSACEIVIPVNPRPNYINMTGGTGQIVADLDEDEHTLIFTIR